MPYAKNSHDRIPYYLKNIRKVGAIKMEKPEIAIKEMLVRGEVVRRDFTKRQMNLIGMIFTYSYYLGKERAIIPKMQDFEICGISKIKVRKELTQLVELGVIEWCEKEHSFSFKDTREWKVKFHSGYNDERALALFELNLTDAGVEVEG